MVAGKDNRDLRQALRGLPVPSLSDQARQDLLERMLQIHQASLEAGPADRASSATGRLVSRRARRLLAAGLLLCVTLGGLYGLLLHRSAAAQVHFADVTRKIRQMESVRYRVTLWEGARRIARYKYYQARRGLLSRTEDIDTGKTGIRDLEQGKFLVLSGRKSATATMLHVDPQTGKGQTVVEALAQVHHSAAALSGEERLDGRRTLVFHITGSEPLIRIWVDPETNLPVKIEVPETVAPKSASAPRAVMIVDQFEWDCPLSPALFALTLPEGYVWAEQRVAAAVEEDLLDLLKAWTQVLQGALPDSLERHAMNRALDRLADQEDACHNFVFRFGDFGWRAASTGGPPEAVHEAIIRDKFFLQKVADRDWHYQGGGVRLGDADTAVCWWRDEKPGIFRVVYGDLSVRDHAESDLATLRRRPAATAPTASP